MTVKNRIGGSTDKVCWTRSVLFHEEHNSSIQNNVPNSKDSSLVCDMYEYIYCCGVTSEDAMRGVSKGRFYVLYEHRTCVCWYVADER